MTICVIATLLALIAPLHNPATEPVDDLLKVLYAALDNNAGAWEFRVESGLSPQEIAATPWRAVRLPDDSKEYVVRYRTTVTIPAVYGGAKVTGGPAILDLSAEGPSDFTLSVSVNGVDQGAMPVIDPLTKLQSVPKITLSENAKPGQTFAIEMVVHNKLIYPAFDYPLNPRTVSVGPAKLLLPQQQAAWDALDAFRINIETAWMLTKPWSEFSTAPRPWSNSIDRRVWYPDRVSKSKLDPAETARLRTLLNEAGAAFDVAAMKAGDAATVTKSIDATFERLAPIGALAKNFTIYIVGNAHIDLAWLWRTRETQKIAENTFRSVLSNMEQFPEMIFAQSQAQAYAWVEKNNPALFEKIKDTVKSGHWDVVGGMWAEPDCNLPGGESWVRQILQAKRYFADRFGVDVSLGWNPDSFGYNANMPLFYEKTGIKAFITQKISWNEKTRFPYHLFWWQSADGSRVLTYLPPGGYAERMDPRRMVDQALNYEDATTFREVLYLFGLGDHGGGPNVPMLERARMLMKQPIFPKVEYIRAHDYIAKMTQHDLSTLPVWKDELYLETHQGTFTTQAAVKKYNRHNEMLLEAAEKAATSAWFNGMAWPANELREAWRIILLNQFHDILPGSSITPVYVDARATHAHAQALAEKVIRRAMTTMCAETALKESGWAQVAVYNSLSWDRADFVRVKLPDTHPASLSVVDAAGKVYPCRILSVDDGLGEELVFHAEGVPAMGMKLFTLKPAPADAAEKAVDPKRTSIENEYLKVEVDPLSGNITSLIDKRSGRQLIAAGAGANALELRENIPSFWDAWNIGYTGRIWKLDTADSVRLVEDDDMRSLIRVEKSFLGPSKANWEPTQGFPSSFFTQDIILWKGQPKLDVVMHIDWWEDHIQLKVAFPFAFDADRATYEIPYGSLSRTTLRQTEWQKARAEVPVHRWADITVSGSGVSLLNDCKYGMDTEGAIMRLTLLNSPMWPDPLADRGTHELSYEIYPHAGDWREAGVVQEAAALNAPLFPLLLTGEAQRHDAAGDGMLAGVAPRIVSDHVMITAVKKAEDDDGVIIRLVETAGRGDTVTLTFPANIASCSLVDMLEHPLGTSLTPNGNTLMVPVPANGVTTVKIMR